MSSTVRLATVTVTFHPDLNILRLQLSQLPCDATRIIVDNASTPEIQVQLRALAMHAGAILINNPTNLGLAEASNIGVARAREYLCDRILFLDQDTEPGPEGVHRLCEAHALLDAEGGPLACMGPRLVDVATGLEHGFHQIRGWRYVRVWPPAGQRNPLPCTGLNGSGILVPLQIFDALGGFAAEFFIDHVDTEWAFRVLAAGFGLYGTPQVAFKHRMGQKTWKFWWFGWRVWPYRSPMRQRYLFRNAVRLMQRDYVPLTWKVWAVMKLGITVVAHGIFDHQRLEQLASMGRGFCDGWHLERGGRIA